MNSTQKTLNQNLALSLYFFLKLAPILVSGMAIYLGYKLFVLGVTGQASLSVETHSVKGQLLNAAPGLFFALGGIVALIWSVHKGVKIESKALKDFLNLGIVSHGTTGVDAPATKEDKPGASSG
jgi:hypothetical protein